MWSAAAISEQSMPICAYLISYYIACEFPWTAELGRRQALRQRQTRQWGRHLKNVLAFSTRQTLPSQRKSNWLTSGNTFGTHTSYRRFVVMKTGATTTSVLYPKLTVLWHYGWYHSGALADRGTVCYWRLTLGRWSPLPHPVGGHWCGSLDLFRLLGDFQM